MNIIANVFKSSLGRKFVMAVSGFALFLFVLGHLAGNLQIFLGPEAINRYGHFLQSNPEVIWPARLFLLLMVGLHIWSAAKLSLENTAARPVACTLRAFCDPALVITRARRASASQVNPTAHTCSEPSARTVVSDAR